LYAIIKAGGAYVPLDMSYPVQRLKFMLNNAQVKVLVTQAALLKAIPENEAEIVWLDLEEKEIGRQPSWNPEVKVEKEDLAYVIYTSGSTGQPKGVQISQQALCNPMVWMQREFGFGANDSVVQKTPFSFDASVWEFYAPLLAGGRLVMAEPDGHQNPGYLVNL